MGAYTILPLECLVQILGFLTLSDAAALLRTSVRWNTAITENENTVYSKLAYNHGLISSPHTSLAAARRGWVSPAIAGAQTWKQYCLVRTNTKRRWEGEQHAYVSLDLFGSQQRLPAFCFKIDTEKQLFALTGGRDAGGLVVYSLRDPKSPLLFELPQIRAFARMEMSNGFVVFTCRDFRSLEVWRWAIDQRKDPVECEPEPQQVEMYQAAMKSAGFSLCSSPNRGELVPVGVLHHPGDALAMRLAYPTLIVGSQDCSRLWLWDIRTRELVQTITHMESNPNLVSMRYVDVNETHAFVATDVVSVYSRATGQCVFRLSSASELAMSSCLGEPTPSTEDEDTQPFVRLALQPSHPTRCENTSHNPHPGGYASAVQVSPDGRDFVAIGYNGYIFHVSGFDAVKKAAHGDGGNSSVEISDPPRAVTQSGNSAQGGLAQPRISFTRLSETNLSQLAYDGKRIVASGLNGTCVITLQETLEQPGEAIDLKDDEFPTAKLYPFPAQFASLVPPFGSSIQPYMRPSCLQVTQEGFWVAWPGPGASAGRFFKTVGMVDFARPRDCVAPVEVGGLA